MTDTQLQSTTWAQSLGGETVTGIVVAEYLDCVVITRADDLGNVVVSAEDAQRVIATGEHLQGLRHAWRGYPVFMLRDDTEWLVVTTARNSTGAKPTHFADIIPANTFPMRLFSMVCVDYAGGLEQWDVNSWMSATKGGVK